MGSLMMREKGVRRDLQTDKVGNSVVAQLKAFQKGLLVGGISVFKSDTKCCYDANKAQETEAL